MKVVLEHDFIAAEISGNHCEALASCLLNRFVELHRQFRIGMLLDPLPLVGAIGRLHLAFVATVAATSMVVGGRVSWATPP